MMQLALLDGHPRARWLQRRDPRWRVVTALLWALSVVSLTQLPGLLAALLLSLLFASLVGLALNQLLRRLLALEGFMLVLLALLPFTTPGDLLFTLGPLEASHEGVTRALQILLRANAVVIGLMALVGTLEPVDLGHALARLRLPEKLVHLFLLTIRYINVLFDEYQRLRQAMRARAFVAGNNRHTWRALGWLTGMLLVRSMARAERVLAAMKCRGFQGRLYLFQRSRWQTADSLALLAGLPLMAAPLALEFLL